MTGRVASRLTALVSLVMNAVLASIIAVMGTLAGTTSGYVFQRLISARSDVTAREERTRQERLVAYSAFAGAVMDLRRAQYDRWHRRQDHPQHVDHEAASDESYRLRSAAWSAFYRFRLITADAHLIELGRSAIEAAAQVSKAVDEDDVNKRGDRARELVERFVAAAAVQFDSTRPRVP